MLTLLRERSGRSGVCRKGSWGRGEAGEIRRSWELWVKRRGLGVERILGGRRGRMRGCMRRMDDRDGYISLWRGFSVLAAR